MKQNISDVNIMPQHKVAAGIDIHKDSIFTYVCNVETGFSEEKTWDTFTQTLHEIANYLNEHQVECILMESTGVYWSSLYHILREKDLHVIVANPQHIKAIPKRKTDKKDAKWLCTLAINRLVRKSFIPESEQHQIRELSRMIEKYNYDETMATNRIVKILERANIKLKSVATRIKGKTCQLIIQAIIGGETDCEKLADLAKGSLRTKKEEIKKAVVGRLTEADKLNLSIYNDDIKHYQLQKQKLEKHLANSLTTEYEKCIEILDSISGIGAVLGRVIIAEIGIDMSKFENADHLTSWAGLAPGNNESAGKIKNSSTKKGNKSLRTAMITAAWGAVQTKNSFWSYQFAFMKSRMPKKKAITAIARKLLKLAYNLLCKKEKYDEGGKVLFDKILQNKRNLNKKQVAV
jgi:transposase